MQEPSAQTVPAGQATPEPQARRQAPWGWHWGTALPAEGGGHWSSVSQGSAQIEWVTV